MTGAAVVGVGTVVGGAGCVVAPPPPPPPLSVGTLFCGGVTGPGTGITAESSVKSEPRQSPSPKPGARPSARADDVGVAGSAEVAEVQPVAADEGRVVGGLGGPVDDADVVVVGGDLVDHLVDLGTVGTELGDGEQHGRPRRQPVDDFGQVLGEHRLVGAVVVAEHHDGDVPVGVEAGVEDAVAEVDEATGLGIHLDLPAAWHQLAAHLTAVATRRRRHDRVADHQHPLALDEVAERRPTGVRVGIGLVDELQPAPASAAGAVERDRSTPARSTPRRARRQARWMSGGAVAEPTRAGDEDGAKGDGDHGEEPAESCHREG